MDLCSTGHEEVCYESSYCPVCTVKEKLQNEIDDLGDRVEVLKADIEILDKRLEEAKTDEH